MKGFLALLFSLRIDFGLGLEGIYLLLVGTSSSIAVEEYWFIATNSIDIGSPWVKTVPILELVTRSFN